MAFKTLEELPNDLKENLQEGSQQIFMTAFNSAQSDGMSEDSARQVAWNSVKQYYDQGEDGKWHRKPQDSNRHGSMYPLGGS